MLSWLAVIGGFALLVWSAERFVHGAAALARNLGVSPLVIGMTIMGFGTSAPEMLVSALAATSGNPNLGVGNALGSNIANIGLVLGATALVMPLAVASRILRREYPVLLLVTLLAGALIVDGNLSRVDGAVLLSGAVVLTLWLIWVGKHPRNTDPLQVEFETEIPSGIRTGNALSWTLVGLVILVLSAKLLVWGAVNIAHELGVSDLVIGLTIVAVGTSLPELAASMMSAFKGEDDMAVGNVIGSNMLNTLAVLALPGLLQPGELEAAVIQRDFPVVVAFTLALFFMAYGFKGQGRINRLEGALLLAAFAGYMSWLA
jgi:cation:H+ antiporter